MGFDMLQLPKNLETLALSNFVFRSISSFWGTLIYFNRKKKTHYINYSNTTFFYV